MSYKNDDNLPMRMTEWAKRMETKLEDAVMNIAREVEDRVDDLNSAPTFETIDAVLRAFEQLANMIGHTNAAHTLTSSSKQAPAGVEMLAALLKNKGVGQG